MRFLMLNWRDPKNPLSGGAERVTQAYLAALVQRGHEVCWFTHAYAGAAAEEIVDGIRYLRSGGNGTSIFNAIQWYRRQPRFDLVIDQHHGLPWYAPMWGRTPCVAYIHEVLGPIWSVFYRWPLSRIGQVQERLTLRAYRRVPFMTPSQSTAAALGALGVQEVKVIPNGCDTVPLAALSPKPFRAPLRLVAVSRLAGNKRVDHALRVLRLLLDRGIDAKLSIVGRGEAKPALLDLCRQLNLTDHVRFTGEVSEAQKNAELREAHLLLHTSVREGWGLNVIEANAMGTPAIVYPVGGLVDSTVHGVTGLVVEAETPEAIVRQLESLLRDPDRYDRYRLNAWRRAAEFNWNTILPQAADWLERKAGPAVSNRSLPHRG